MNLAVTANKISEIDLILNADGSVYHLALSPEDIADVIIVVGDPNRVTEVSRYFDKVELKKQRREFITHTGLLNNKRITVLSTGIGTGNIDIVMNELDALVNVDLVNRVVKPQNKHLQIVRLGTTSALHESIPLNSIVASDYAIGIDGLAHFYQYQQESDANELQQAFVNYFAQEKIFANAYAASADSKLLKIFSQYFIQGITITNFGFYAPQGRVVRAQLAVPNLVERLSQFRWQNKFPANLEMETAAIYSMGKILGHQCCSLSACIGNRATKKFSDNIAKAVDDLIRKALEIIVANL